MKFSDLLWEIADNGLYVLHVIAVLACFLCAIAVPLWLRVLHNDLTAIREKIRPCECRHDDPGPVLPRVLPRLRRLGEEVED